MGKRVIEPAVNPSEEVAKPKVKKKPCRICTLLDPERNPTPHDSKWLHTDTNQEKKK